MREDYCLMDVQGVGYRIFMNSKSLAALKKNQELLVYTYTNVREDAILLYGFLTQEEYDTFVKLISVSGIGSKVALVVLANLSPAALQLAIQTKDSKVLLKVPGIGKKTAERLILELQDRFRSDDISITVSDVLAPQVDTQGNVVQDTALALQALGYDAARAYTISKAVYKDGESVQDCLKLALKELARR